jgi:hypothetical protein
VLDIIATHGTLARRILRALGGRSDRERMREVYTRLCECLRCDTTFVAA